MHKNVISDVSRTWAYLMGVDRSLRKYFSTVIISHVFRKQNFETCRCWTIILYFVTIYQYNKVRWHQCVPWNLWYLGALNTKLILHIMSNLNLELTWIYSAFSILHSFDVLTKRSIFESFTDDDLRLWRYLILL